MKSVRSNYENLKYQKFKPSGCKDLETEFLPWDRTLKKSKLNVFDVELLSLQLKFMFQDPLSVCDCSPPYSAENSISARNDLNPL